MENLNYFKKYSSYKEEKNTNRNVWLYTRVSSKNQFDKNNSIENQTRAAEIYAKENNYVITKTFGGTYESAKGDFSRKEFTKFYNDIITAKNKPLAVMIFKMSRFSRTGAKAISLASELINVHNVHLIEVSTNKDTTTQRGEHEIIESLNYARKENIERLEVTIPGMIAHVRNGNWLGKAPRGYDHYGTRVKNPRFISGSQRLEINKEGELLKKAWQWKLEGLPDYQIRQQLTNHGFNITKQSMSAMWRNPFYCGINTNSLLKGDVVKGNWKPLVTINDFKKINEILDSNKNTGYKQSKHPMGRPLQSHLFCGICGTKMTGYVKKQTIHYYKCQNRKCKCKDLNANSSKKSIREGLHNIFEEYLKQFTLKESFIEIFKKQMELTIKHKEKDQISLEKSLTSQLENLKIKLKKLDNKFIYEDLDKDLYYEHKTQLKSEIDRINEEKLKLGVKISNLNEKINKCVEVTQNISKYWASGNIQLKMGVQKLIFPKGMVIDSEKRQYRTSEINAVFSLISSISKDEEPKTKNAPSNLDDASYSVAGTAL